jgi:UDP-GlcNAc:undecaprenyl-phosphate GlcNAc-1-phosphate transferase
MSLALVAAAVTAAAFALGTILSAITIRVAPKLGLVDTPGGRKAHKAPTPLGGGVAIWLTVVLCLGMAAILIEFPPGWLPQEVARHAPGARMELPRLGGILLLATLIMAMGLADDRFGLGWKPRLAMQVGLATLLVAWLGVRLTLFEPFSHPFVSGAITVLWVVGLTNSFNFLDNMDGLAAGVGLIAASLFVAAQVAVESLFVPAVLLVLIGALGGFLVYNRSPARLFMGDAGSNFLGFMLGTWTVAGTFTREHYSPFSVLTPLLVMAVPLYDTISVILIRIKEGRSPFQPDRSHFSHRLVERGLTAPAAVRTIDLVTLAGGLGALLLHRPEMDALGAAIIVGQALCLLGVIAALEVSRKTERIDAPTHADPNTQPRDPAPLPRTVGGDQAPR